MNHLARKLLVFLLVFAPILRALETPSDKIAILIVGSFHFTTSRTDAHNVDPGDMMTSERQKEIADVVARLAAFQPDIIAVERSLANQEKGDASYADYLAGKKELTANELHQIGYKLGRALGKDRLFGVDSPMEMDFPALMESAKTNGQMDLLARVNELGGKFTKETQTYLATHTLRDALLWCNTPDALLANHRSYINLIAHIGAGKDFTGARVVGAWYERNLRIFGNISRLGAKPGQRIVFVVGQGHAPILRQLFKDTGVYQVVDVADVL